MRHPRLDLRAMLACCRHDDALDRLAAPCRPEETLGARKRAEIRALWPERHRGAWYAFREGPQNRERRREERQALHLVRVAFAGPAPQKGYVLVPRLGPRLMPSIAPSLANLAMANLAISWKTV